MFRFQSFRQVGPNRIRLGRRCVWRGVRGHQGHQRSRFGHRKEAQKHSLRRALHLQNRKDRRSHRHGLFRNGTRLPPADPKSPQDGLRVRPDVRGTDSDLATGFPSGLGHAGIHPERRCQTLRRVSAHLRLGQGGGQALSISV